MDQPKLERLLRVITFMTDSRHYSIADMAKSLGISKRSVYRYVETLKRAGFVVEEVGKSVPKLCKSSILFDDISQLIHFTAEEAHIFNQLLDGLTDTNVLKQNLRKKLSAVCNCKSFDKSAINTQRSQNVNLLQKAVADKKQVILKNYASSHSGEVRDRRVEVLELTQNHVQMWCFDVEDRRNKLFNVARVETVEVLETNWLYEDDHKKGMIDIFRTSGFDEPKPVTLKLTVMARNLLVEEFPLSEELLSKLDENHWLLRTSISNFRGAGRFVMGLLGEVEIIDSPEFEQYIAEQIKTFSGKYLG